MGCLRWLIVAVRFIFNSIPRATSTLRAFCYAGPARPGAITRAGAISTPSIYDTP